MWLGKEKSSQKSVSRFMNSSTTVKDNMQNNLSYKKVDAFYFITVMNLHSTNASESTSSLIPTRCTHFIRLLMSASCCPNVKTSSLLFSIYWNRISTFKASFTMLRYPLCTINIWIKNVIYMNYLLNKFIGDLYRDVEIGPVYYVNTNILTS